MSPSALNHPALRHAEADRNSERVALHRIAHVGEAASPGAGQQRRARLGAAFPRTTQLRRVVGRPSAGDPRACRRQDARRRAGGVEQGGKAALAQTSGGSSRPGPRLVVLPPPSEERPHERRADLVLSSPAGRRFGQLREVSDVGSPPELLVVHAGAQRGAGGREESQRVGVEQRQQHASKDRVRQRDERRSDLLLRHSALERSAAVCASSAVAGPAARPRAIRTFRARPARGVRRPATGVSHASQRARRPMEQPPPAQQPELTPQQGASHRSPLCERSLSLCRAQCGRSCWSSRGWPAWTCARRCGLPAAEHALACARALTLPRSRAQVFDVLLDLTRLDVVPTAVSQASGRPPPPSRA